MVNSNVNGEAYRSLRQPAEPGDGLAMPGRQRYEPAPARRVPPPEHLMPILQQLLTGATDHTASRLLGLSPRTYSRRVSELLEFLGVASRFQAGVEAARRGLVSSPPRLLSDQGNRCVPVSMLSYERAPAQVAGPEPARNWA